MKKPKAPRPAPDWWLVYRLFFPKTFALLGVGTATNEVRKKCQAVLRAVRADCRGKFMAEERERWIKYSNNPHNWQSVELAIDEMYPVKKGKP